MGTLAVNYYLKALDNYPYDLKEVVESLEYALSYDDEYADAHHLMGRLQLEYMKQMDEAQYHFDRALYADVNNISTYYSYLNWCIVNNEYQIADRLLSYAHKIRGINRPVLYYKEALLFEKQSMYVKAIKRMKIAIEGSLSTCDIDFFKSEKRRIDGKQKSKKKSSSRSKRSKKKKKKK